MSAGRAPHESRRALLVFLAATLLTGVAAGLATGSDKTGWYRRLAKPDWTPPDAVFPIVWTLLYIVMAVAAWRVWKSIGWSGPALTLFWVQLALNFAWSFLFFAWHQTGLALLDAALLFAALAVTTILFSRIDRLGGLLLLPYLAWTSYAVALNFAIWRMNG